MSSSTPSKVGAATAAVVLFAMVMVPASIAAINSPFVAGWWPLILIFTLPWTAIAALVGSFVGRLAARTTNTSGGAVIGIAVSLPVGFVAARLFNSPIEPWDNFIGTIVHAAVPGAFAGAVSTVIARSTMPECRRFRIALADGVVFSFLLTATGIWYGHLILESDARSRIVAVGGSVSWNAIGDDRGAWEVTLQGKHIGDSEIEVLLPTLARYPRLDLDIGHSRVTDAGLERLSRLASLQVLSLTGTQVTDAGVAELQHVLPKLAIKR